MCIRIHILIMLSYIILYYIILYCIIVQHVIYTSWPRTRAADPRQRHINGVVSNNKTTILNIIVNGISF